MFQGTLTGQQATNQFFNNFNSEISHAKIIKKTKNSTNQEQVNKHINSGGGGGSSPQVNPIVKSIFGFHPSVIDMISPINAWSDYTKQMNSEPKITENQFGGYSPSVNGKTLPQSVPAPSSPYYSGASVVRNIPQDYSNWFDNLTKGIEKNSKTMGKIIGGFGGNLLGSALSPVVNETKGLLSSLSLPLLVIGGVALYLIIKK